MLYNHEHNLVVLFRSQRVGGGRRETRPPGNQVRADDRERGTGSVWKEKQERLLTNKTPAKKEKVVLAKKNVLILCS